MDVRKINFTKDGIHNNYGECVMCGNDGNTVDRQMRSEPPARDPKRQALQNLLISELSILESVSEAGVPARIREIERALGVIKQS